MQQNKLDDLLFSRAYDPTREPPPDQIVFRIDGKNIGSLQNLVTITGFQKNGKGKYIAALIAAALSDDTIFDLSVRLPLDKKGIVLFDTEQGDFDFYRSIDTIKNLAGISTVPPWFSAFNVREDEPIKILSMIERYLQLHPETGMLVLDGLTDLVLSYNDEAECKKVINILKRISKIYNVLIPAVLHKGKSTQSTIGHLGAMADRAAQSVLTVEKMKDRGTFQLRADYLRSADEITPIEIWFNPGSHSWEQTNYIPPEDEKVKRIKAQPHEFPKETHVMNLHRVFSAETKLPYRDLIQSIKEVYATGESWAKQCVPHLMGEQLLFKISGNLYVKDQRQALAFS